MPINEDLLQELRYHWVKDFGVGLDNAVSLALLTPPSTTPATESLPDTLTSSTPNNLGGGYHTHAVDAVSDASTPGNYGKLLKAGSLGNLAVNDLLAGGGLLRVDTVGGRIGIGMAADPQFMLDVAGPVRAPYFVGKHAIQLADALMICHYDGKENDLTGEAAGHRGQAATLVGGVSWQKGKFSKAIAIGEGTTNIHGNPDFEGGVTGWVGGGGGSITHNGEKSWLGKFCGKASLPASGYVYYPVTCVASTTYAYSAYVWSDIPATVNIQLSDGISQNLSSGSLAIPAKRWTRIYFSGTTNANTARLFAITNVGASTITLYIDACQVEAKAYATPYVAGSRANAGVRYSAVGNLDRQIGTVMAWVNPGAGNNSGYGRVVVRCDTTGGTMAISITPAGNWEYYWGATSPATNAGAAAIGTWTHVALTYDGVSTLCFYVNGALVSTNSNGSAISSVSAFGGAPIIDVGQYSGNGSFNINGMIDELAITSTALSADAIKAVYESDAPVFAESSTFSFKIPKSTVWADENGLFVISDAGNPVMGAIAYTGGYSWGGQTLQAGDFLLGYGTSYAKWDKTTATFRVAGNIDAQSGSISGVLSIGAAGGIYQGSGSFASPTTGLKISNSAGVGKIEGWNLGVLQWYAGSDGNLYAGAGKFVVTNAGVRLIATGAYDEQAALSTYFGANKIQNLYATRDDGITTVSGFLEIVGPNTHQIKNSLVATTTGGTQSWVQVNNNTVANQIDLVISGVLSQRVQRTYWETTVGARRRMQYYPAGSTSGTAAANGVAATAGGGWTIVVKSSSGVNKVFTGTALGGTGTLYQVDVANDFFVGFDGSWNPYWARQSGTRTYEVALDFFYL